MASLLSHGCPYLYTIHDEDMTFFVEESHVTGLQPAVFCDSVFRGIWLTPVPFHDGRSAYPQLASLSSRDLGSGCYVHNLAFDVGVQLSYSIRR